MNIAIIIAGGSGNRMGQDIPKQFINVYDKPVLIYTLEGFQKHPLIDAIEVVCISGWENMVQAYANQFNITKLKWIVPGGNSAQESIRNGVFNLEGKCSDNDTIVFQFAQALYQYTIAALGDLSGNLPESQNTFLKEDVND